MVGENKRNGVSRGCCKSKTDEIETFKRTLMHFFLSVWVQGRKWKEVTPHLRIRQTSNVWRPLESTVSFHSLYINYTKCKKSALFSGERSERTLYFGLPPPKNPSPSLFLCMLGFIRHFIYSSRFVFFFSSQSKLLISQDAKHCNKLFLWDVVVVEVGGGDAMCVYETSMYF